MLATRGVQGESMGLQLLISREYGTGWTKYEMSDEEITLKVDWDDRDRPAMGT
jgi:hypothetical protein